ncbi:protein FAR1-RELATED SEQUENCE 5-like [Apium graveolens]|uniref:protein FAR1-RELATED SEQUENCE 5-like n=1 Tax=Apium graveolens TaxID=4045 RepID=UPI003D7A93AC
MRDCGRNSAIMAPKYGWWLYLMGHSSNVLLLECFIAGDTCSSSSSENDNYDYYTPVRRNPVARRKLFVDEDIVNLDSDDNMNNVGGDNIDVDNVSVHNVDNNVDGDNVDDNVGGDNVGGHNIDDNVGGDNFDGENIDDVKDEKNVEKKNHGFKNSNDVVPYVGKIFDTLDDAEAFYRNYGRKEGFEIIIRNTHKRTNINEPSYRLFICRKGGRVGATTLDFGKGKRVREVIPQTNCGARMRVVHKVKMDKWQISSQDKGGVENLGFSNQEVRNVIRDIRRRVFDSGDAECGLLLLRELQENSFGNFFYRVDVGFSNQDVRNVIHDIRRRVFDSGDAECGLLLLRELQENSFGNFFYRVDVDDENRVRGLVWVDPRSMNAYKNFGDVVMFDSTYRTNRYCMHFIPITGVNHHYQNILFGLALVRDETEASYKWVLRTWLEVVDNKPPRIIITDQDIVLGNAIVEVMPMPQTKHTYCIWHISSKFPEKLSYLYINYPEFKTEFNACVYKSLTPTEFEGRWEQLVEKYDLEDHAWLNDMYAIRTQWIGAYTKQHFSAGMTTTSRSESINSFFDEYVQSSTDLKEFIENSQKALETQYLKEVKADYDSEQLERRLVLYSSLEMHASEIYTKEMFKRFQKELMKSTCYIVNSVKNNGTYMSKLYLVEKATLPENCRRKYRVTVFMYKKIECSCKKFEHSGMICKHIIRYLDKKQKIKIPKSLVMGRWTMNGNKITGPLPYAPPGIGNDVASQPFVGF